MKSHENNVEHRKHLLTLKTRYTPRRIESKFDPFLQQHLSKLAEKGTGKVSYMSKTICEEIVKLMGAKVHNHTIMEIREAKHYSIILDSTPD